MKQVISISYIFVSILLISYSYAQTVYYWKDEKGVMNATTTPPPDNIKKYDTDSYSKDSKAEIEQYQRQEDQKRKVNEARVEANRRANQTQEAAQRQQRAQQEQHRKTQSEIQDMRNRQADKLEAEAKSNIPGSRGMTAAQRKMLENASKIRAGQEPVPYTPPPIEKTQPKGAINVRTGEYYPPAAGGVIEPKTGTFMPDVGGGYIDSRTGKFIPKIGY